VFTHKSENVHYRFYTEMADAVPGNSGTSKGPGFPWIGENGSPGIDTLPVKECQRYTNLNPGHLFVQQPPKS